MKEDSYIALDRDFDTLPIDDLIEINRKRGPYNRRIRALMAACRRMAGQEHGIEEAIDLIQEPQNIENKVFNVNAYAFFGIAALLYADPVHARPYIDQTIGTWSQSDQADVKWFLNHSDIPSNAKF